MSRDTYGTVIFLVDYKHFSSLQANLNKLTYIKYYSYVLEVSDIYLEIPGINPFTRSLVQLYLHVGHRLPSSRQLLRQFHHVKASRPLPW